MGTLSSVIAVAPAPSEAALAHFESSLRFETDCADVHDALVVKGLADFVLLDVRSPSLFAAGHVPGAVNLPHGKIIASKLTQYAPDTVFVTYCAGPHCNGATRGAIRLAKLGRPVKIMIGGITGWLDEGFTLATEADAAPSPPPAAWVTPLTTRPAHERAPR
ncbi:rhodanese-like domain-containing protein [Trinickia dinghuensis]|uniref:Rhodanese-like domain-containing protein n=1 Tax=Trinickia dinghuensis TaxID=2291023 RepID=A0A3D8JVC8_9BURK|nr:rhodanese-like domain-containing protein [Trinickia dinghuensis]RDU96810.1 rhodanese-like domain-containing protein [Trinickia dinghuensis]